MAAPNQDPFYIVKEEVMQSLNGISTLHDRWKQLIENGESNSDEFGWTGNDIKSGIRTIEWDLGDLEDTITVVEGNRGKFKLEQAEINARKEFVAATKRKIAAIKDEVERFKGVTERNQRNQLMGGRQDDKFVRLQEAMVEDNQRFIEGQSQRQAQIFKTQDAGLDRLKDTVGNLKEIGNTISSELEEHDKIISDINTEVDKADTGLKGVVKKVNELIDKTSDGKQMCIIVVLILILVALVVVVFYV